LIYADTSFLASLYLQDGNSADAQRWFTANSQPILLSRLSELELSNACRLSVFRGWITERQSQIVLAAIEDDLRKDVLIRRAFEADEIFTLSQSLSSQHTLRNGNRTLDIMHIALAVHSELSTFATFDKRQSVLAKECALDVVPFIS
jgi:predicted nucleic acid-binding protein